MGFNKKFISRNSLKSIADSNDYIYFFKYFNSDAVLFEDNFSLNIMKELKNYTILDCDDIIKIMNKCK